MGKKSNKTEAAEPSKQAEAPSTHAPPDEGPPAAAAPPEPPAPAKSEQSTPEPEAPAKPVFDQERIPGPPDGKLVEVLPGKQAVFMGIMRYGANQPGRRGFVFRTDAKHARSLKRQGLAQYLREKEL